MSDEIKSVEAETPIGKFRVAGQRLNDLFTIITCFGMVLIYIFQNQHAEESRTRYGTLIKSVQVSIDAQTSVMKEMARLQREQNCLIAIPPDRRDAELCRRLAQ